MKRLLFLFLSISIQFSYSTEALTRQRVLKVIEQIDQLVIDSMKTAPIPGVSVAVVFKNEMLFLKGYGIREMGKTDAVDVNTVFQLASVSKPITSSVLAALVAEGKVGWKSPIVSFDPAFRLSDPWVTEHVTVADFLSHRSGLFEHAGDLLEDLGYDRRTIIHQLRFIPKLDPFRASYAYTNFGFSEAAYAVASKLNKDWTELAKEKLFVPLRMKNASYSFEDFQHSVNKAVGHQIREDKASPLLVRNPDAQAPAGGASMSIKDLAKWMIFSLDGGSYKGHRVVSANVLLQTQNPYIVSSLDIQEDRINFYGLGWGIKYNEYGQKVLSHSGAFSLGVRSQVVLIPELDIGIAILTNSYPHALPEAISQSFLDLLYTNKIQNDWLPVYTKKFIESVDFEQHTYSQPNEVVSHIDLNRYEGSYYNDFFSEIKIVNEVDQLVLIIGPKSLRFHLNHYNKDTFIMKTLGENSVGETNVVFEFSTAGKPKRVTIDYLNDYGLGVFLPIKKEY